MINFPMLNSHWQLCKYGPHLRQKSLLFMGCLIYNENVYCNRIEVEESEQVESEQVEEVAEQSAEE